MRLESLLENGSQRSPNAVAAIDPLGGSISYQDLNAFAEHVREELVALGVEPGDRVGLCVHKSIGSLASIFGALKAGAAYVPVDVSAPATRDGLIMNDCAVKAVIVEASKAEKLLGELDGDGWTRHAFPAPAEHPTDFVILARPASTAQETAAPPEGLAYILYTSGSTGRPKGVMHSHATALSFIDWCSAELKPQASDRFSSHAPFHFDLSILDIYVPLKHGAAVVLIDSDPGKQPGTLAKIITDHGITIWYSTPSILRMLVEYGKLEEQSYDKLRIVIFAGEVFPIKHLRALMARWPHPTYYNLYGPTETNVCTYYKLPHEISPDVTAPMPIGRACSGDETRVVSPDGTDVPRGEEGELIVTGGSVLLGYWNLASREAEAFLTDKSGRWYRTGDIVRESESGDYIFVGRRDRMVKRRGYRVELGEIEAALYRHPSIGEAAVIATPNDEGETVIHAFLTWSEPGAPSMVKLKQYCSQQIPLYMVPDRFTVLPDLPKTSTDKIDYQNLKGLG